MGPGQLSTEANDDLSPTSAQGHIERGEGAAGSSLSNRQMANAAAIAWGFGLRVAFPGTGGNLLIWVGVRQPSQQ